jgi:hypothetical protein
MIHKRSSLTQSFDSQNEKMTFQFSLVVILRRLKGIEVTFVHVQELQNLLPIHWNTSSKATNSGIKIVIQL